MTTSKLVRIVHLLLHKLILQYLTLKTHPSPPYPMPDRGLRMVTATGEGVSGIKVLSRPKKFGFSSDFPSSAELGRPSELIT